MSIQKKRKNRGSTMVEVIVAFAVLTIVLAAFAEITSLCLRMVVSTGDSRTAVEQQYAQYYAETGGAGTQIYPGSGTGYFIFQQEGGTTVFSVEGKLCEKRYDDMPVYYYEH